MRLNIAFRAVEGISTMVFPEVSLPARRSGKDPERAAEGGEFVPLPSLLAEHFKVSIPVEDLHIGCKLPQLYVQESSNSCTIVSLSLSLK